MVVHWAVTLIRDVVVTTRGSMRTSLAFRLPNSAFEQCDGEVIENKMARLQCDVSLERAGVGIKTRSTWRSRSVAHLC